MTGSTRDLPAQAPDLMFSVERVEVVRESVVPSLAFRVNITRPDGGSIESVSLQVQLRVAAGGRRYTDVERQRLAGLFGVGDQWSRSVRSLHWANVTTVVTSFSGSTTVDVIVPLTYDLEVASAHYLQALDGGHIPVDLLFSGTMFYHDPAGLLQAAMIPWDKEARCQLLLTAWRDAMDLHFPGSAWIRLPQPTFERLQRYRAQHAAPTWEAAIDTLLAGPPT